MPSPTLRLGYHGSTDAAWRILRAGGRNPSDAELVEYDVADPFTPLRAGEVDVMITKFAQRQPDLVYSDDVARDDRIVVLAASHPLAGRASVSVADLVDSDCFRCPGTMPAPVWDEVVPPPLRRVHDLTSTAAMIELVASGAAVHPTVASLRELLPPTVRAVPIRDLPPAPVALAHLPHAPEPVAAFARAAAQAHRDQPQRAAAGAGAAS